MPFRPSLRSFLPIVTPGVLASTMKALIFRVPPLILPTRANTRMRFGDGDRGHRAPLGDLAEETLPLFQNPQPAICASKPGRGMTPMMPFGRAGNRCSILPEAPADHAPGALF